MKSTMTVNSYGDKIWQNKNGDLHREDGPAVEYANGDKSWYLNGQQHREDGPAIEYVNGTKWWYLNGQSHREDGPAVEYYNGDKGSYLNGKELSETDFLKRKPMMKSTMIVNQYGTKEWRNEKGQRHREDGPAVECSNGDKHWYLNGQLHREDGPAIEYADGSKYWYLNDQLHREGGPAIEYANGSKYWFLNGKIHREDGPAVEYSNGGKYYHLNGKELSEADFLKQKSIMKSTMTVNQYGDKEWRNEKGELHREDGPAIEYVDGDKVWYLNGKRHREDGPAIESDGDKYWFLNGQYHREDGPAIEWANGSKCWYLNGRELSEANFLKLQYKEPPLFSIEEREALITAAQIILNAFKGKQ